MTEKPGAPLDPKADRTPRVLATTIIVLVVAVLGVVSYLGYLMATQPRYVSPAQIEIDAARDAVRESPGDPRALLELAYAYQKVGWWDEALSHYALVLEMIPAETGALYNMGIVYLETGESAKAEEVLWDVLEINEEHDLAARALGRYYAERSQYRSLLVAVLPAADANEASADLQYLTGLAHENLGDPELAEEYYRLALKHYPDMPEARSGLMRLGVRQ